QDGAMRKYTTPHRAPEFGLRRGRARARVSAAAELHRRERGGELAFDAFADDGANVENAGAGLEGGDGFQAGLLEGSELRVRQVKVHQRFLAAEKGAVGIEQCSDEGKLLDVAALVFLEFERLHIDRIAHR